MKVKFNKFERVAGLFVLCAFIGAIAIAAGVAIKRGWFDPKIRYVSYLTNAEGLHPGTVIMIAGLRAGSVDSVDLLKDNRVLVKFTVLGKFQSRIRKDSQLQAYRPFIIGDKVLEVSVGSEQQPMLEENEIIAYSQSMDLMDVFSGRTIGNYLQEIGALVENMGTIAKAFSDPKRTEAFIRTFDNIAPLTENLNTMSLEVIDLSQQLTTDKNIGVLIKNLKLTTNELNQFLPMAKKMGPSMMADMSSLVANLNQLTNEFKKLTPIFAQIGPDLPEAGTRAIEAIDEATVVLKALQKTWILSGASEEVREEEQLRAAQSKKNYDRMPASESEEDAEE